MRFRNFALMIAVAIGACAPPVSTSPDRSVLAELSSSERSELNDAVRRGIFPSESAALSALEAAFAAERRVAPEGDLAERRYLPRQPLPSSSHDVTTLTVRSDVPSHAARAIGEHYRSPGALTPPSTTSGANPLARTALSSPTEVGVLAHDGTVINNPARAIHGTAGDPVLRFSISPSPTPIAGGGEYRGVSVHLQVGGSAVGELPAPAGEQFATPLAIKLYNVQRHGLLSTSGRFVLLDTRTQPVEFGTTGVWRSAKLFYYAYSFSPLAGFQATHLETVVLPAAAVAAPGGPVPWVPGSGIVFAGSIALLDRDATENVFTTQRPDVVVTDNFAGGLFYTQGSSLVLGVLDSRMAGGVRAGVISGFGPDGAYDVITPPPPGAPPSFFGTIGIYPGAHSTAHVVLRDESSVRRDDICWAVSWANNADGSPNPSGMGIHCLATADLVNPALPPFVKTGDPAFGSASVPSYRLLVPGSAGLADLTDALDNDRWSNAGARWLYWMRAPADAVNQGCANRSALRRVNVETGAVQLVKCDAEFFAWTNEVSSTPSFFGFSGISKILPSVGQEYNNPNLNFLISLGTPRSYFVSRMPTVYAPAF